MQDADYQERAVFAGDVSGVWSSRLNRKGILSVCQDTRADMLKNQIMIK